MIATHTLVAAAPRQDRPLWHWLASGRASALFAVLAGVSMALMSGGARPVRGGGAAAATTGLAVRAVLIAALGLALGGSRLGAGGDPDLLRPAVPARAAVPRAAAPDRCSPSPPAGWCWRPVVAYLLAPHLPARTYALPSFERLDEPGRLLAELTVTGYYPVLPWLAYLLAGLAVGRLDLRRRGVDVRLAAVGAGLAVAAQVLAEWLPPAENAADFHGSIPPEAGWDLLLIADPHSGDAAGPGDHARQRAGGDRRVPAGGAAGCRGQGERGLAVAFGAGTMTLSLYSLHVLLHTPEWWPDDYDPPAFCRARGDRAGRSARRSWRCAAAGRWSGWCGGLAADRGVVRR